MTIDVRFDREKFQEAILYVASESEEDQHFGATKLNKILYFADFKSFGILGRPITGATYVRLERGPAPREMLPALREMEAEGSISRIERRYFNLLQKRVVPEQEPTLAVFTGEELEILGNVIDELRHLNAAEVTALSHLETGWRLAEPGEPIPYAMTFLSRRRPSSDEVEGYVRSRLDPSAWGVSLA